ncbi:MAG: glycerol-3-phosphate 1-O-acyltransferase PlsY [Deltaproteobacteria bacterium]|nr:glycerol-3-phosphate 1-O-acyltransferase PlsY [Deltaproteobacteria bacterium]
MANWDGLSREGGSQLAVPLWALFSFLCGSIPFGLLITRAVAGKDVREIGSGNIGATNVARAAGKGAAIATLVLDALKGLIPTLLALKLTLAAGPLALASKDQPRLAAICALCAVLGHCFTPWLKFKGGKGVATGLGVALALAPIAALAGAVVWVLLYKVLRISSVGSLAGVLVALVVAAFTAPLSACVSLGVISAVIVLRHTENLKRILAGREK